MWCLALFLTILQCVQSQELEDVGMLEETGRQIQLQNVSLVITYTGIVVAALMMAGFLYIAMNFGRGRRYGYYAEDDYYDYGGHYNSGGYHFNKRSIEGQFKFFSLYAFNIW